MITDQCYNFRILVILARFVGYPETCLSMKSDVVDVASLDKKSLSSSSSTASLSGASSLSSRKRYILIFQCTFMGSGVLDACEFQDLSVTFILND